MGRLKGILTGGLFGLVAGILMAPKKGEETRSELLEKGEELQNKAKEFSSQAKDKAEELIEKARGLFGKK